MCKASPLALRSLRGHRLSFFRSVTSDFAHPIICERFQSVFFGYVKITGQNHDTADRTVYMTTDKRDGRKCTRDRNCRLQPAASSATAAATAATTAGAGAGAAAAAAGAAAAAAGAAAASAPSASCCGCYGCCVCCACCVCCVCCYFRTPRGEPRTSRRRRASGLRPCLRAWNRWQCMREKRRATQDNARQAAAAHGQHQRDPHASSMCTIGFGTSINSASPLLGHRRRWRL